MSDDDTFSLERLEHLAYARRHEDAAREIIKLLTHLHDHLGGWGEIGNAPTGHPPAEQRDVNFATRLAAAITALFSDPNFQLSELGFLQLIQLQRFLSTIFGASPFGNADHIIHLLNQRGYADQKEITITGRDLFKFCLLYSPDSTIPLQPEILWRENKRLAASLFVALLSARIAASEEAHAKREQLLEWLPPRLEELTLDDFPVGILHDAWMHCSYADRPDKHAIKRAINKLIRAKLLASGFEDFPVAPPPERERPVVMVITEWFTSNHSIYRTHSLSAAALREGYRVVGVSLRGYSDEVSQRTFDEVHITPKSPRFLENVKHVLELAAEIQPDIVYYPSVGMFPETIFLINLRLAPIQLVALGHPATTHSPFVDYVLVEEDYVGDPACFSEKLVTLPKESIPYRPPENCPKIPPKIRTVPDPVRIAVAATVMKLNPGFLKALKRIGEQAKVSVEFHFFSGMAIGLSKVYLQNLIRRVLPDSAILYPHLPYDRYLQNINRCDLFVNPFPFGNTNGIVDTVRQGLPGICMTGLEVHSHIDKGLFERLGLPQWLIARSTDEYINAAVRLVDNSLEREELCKRIQEIDPDTVLFQGNARLFLEALKWLHQHHVQLAAQRSNLLRPPLDARACA